MYLFEIFWYDGLIIPVQPSYLSYKCVSLGLQQLGNPCKNDKFQQLLACTELNLHVLHAIRDFFF